MNERPYRRKIPSGVDSPVSGLANHVLGDMAYWDGSAWRRLPKGAAGEVLVVNSGGIPEWQGLSEAGIADTDHSADHEEDGADEILVEDLGTAGTADQIVMADGSGGLTLASPAGTAQIADVASSEAAGTSDTYARGDHVHAADHGALGGLSDDDHTQYTRKDTLSATGDVYYASSANTPARLAAGSDDQVLTLASGVPTWADASSGVSGLFYIPFGSETNEGQAVTP